MIPFGPPTACASAAGWQERDRRTGKGPYPASGCQHSPEPAGRLHAQVGPSTQCLLHITNVWSGQHCATIPLSRSCPPGGVASNCSGGGVRRLAFAAPERLPVKHDSCEQGDQVVYEWHHIPKDHREHKEQYHAADHEPSDPLRKRTPQERNAKNGQTCRCQ